jgi:sugar phosphate isomerase/epimerase
VSAWPLPLGISTSVFPDGPDPAAVAALATSAVAVIEVKAHARQCPLADPDFRTALAGRLQRANVTARSVHLPYGRDVDISQPDEAARAQAVTLTEANLRMATDLHAPFAVLHPSYEPIAADERAARIAACRRSLEELSRAAAVVGVRLAVECLPRTCLANTAAELLSLIDDLDPAHIGVCIDFNHLNVREPDLAAAVERLGSRLLTVHCSDNDGVDERHWLPGSTGGVIAWPAVLGALRDVAYTGPFLYEVQPPAEIPAEALRIIEANYTGLCRMPSARSDA